jgi:hypothetical protein
MVLLVYFIHRLFIPLCGFCVKRDNGFYIFSDALVLFCSALVCHQQSMLCSVAGFDVSRVALRLL